MRHLFHCNWTLGNWSSIERWDGNNKKPTFKRLPKAAPAEGENRDALTKGAALFGITSLEPQPHSGLRAGNCHPGLRFATCANATSTPLQMGTCRTDSFV